MYPCTKCTNNNWFLIKKREFGVPRDGLQIKDTWIVATCKVCSKEIEFGHKSKVVPELKEDSGINVTWDIRDGKMYRADNNLPYSVFRNGKQELQLKPDKAYAGWQPVNESFWRLML